MRDMLLKRPSKDIDIVTSGDGIELAEKTAKALGIRKVTVFSSFGTAMFMLDDLQLEFVGARKESYRKESRKPAVSPGTISDDQLRRDFTINALALDLGTAQFGAISSTLLTD